MNDVHEAVGVPATEFIGVPEWCRRVGCSLDAGYRAARNNEIPGIFRIGRLMRINWQAFVAATISSQLRLSLPVGGASSAGHLGCSFE